MKKFIFIVLFSALLATFPQAARADYEEGAYLSSAVISPLMAWVEQETGVKANRLPTVEANRGKLLRVSSRRGPTAGRPRAMYVGGMILLDHYLFDAEDATQLSFLVHELVHYAQSLRGRPTGNCLNAREYEAYTLQNKWLQQHGHAPIVSASWINRMASCPTSTQVALAQTR